MALIGMGMDRIVKLDAAKSLSFKIRWQVLVPITALHVGAILAPFYFNWSSFGWAVFLWFATGLWGITVGYHRMLAHRAFKTGPVLRAFHLFWSSISLQQGPISWVRLHRAHHKYSDTKADPHGQLFGAFFGHAGWTFLGHKEIGRSPEVKLIPNDLGADPMIVFFEKIHYPMFLLSLLFFYLAGGLPLLLWAGCLRTVVVLHFTWTVNSLAHRFGYRTYDTKDWSRNNWLVALFTWGEGWHNNHHAFPYSARQGLAWWEFDASWLWIRALELLGLATNVRRPGRLAAPQDRDAV